MAQDDNGVRTKTDTQKPNYHGQLSSHEDTPVTVLIFTLLFPLMMPLSSTLLLRSSLNSCPRHSQQNADAEYESKELLNSHSSYTSHFSSAETHQESGGDKHSTDKSIHCFIVLPSKTLFSSFFFISRILSENMLFSQNKGKASTWLSKLKT